MHFHTPAAERLWWLGTIPSRCVYNRSELTYYQEVLKKHPLCGAFLVFWGFKFLSIKYFFLLSLK